MCVGLVRSLYFLNMFLFLGVIDSSGMRLWLVPKPRIHTSGLLNAGLGFHTISSILPPRMERFYHFGICPNECLRKVSNMFSLFSGLILKTSYQCCTWSNFKNTFYWNTLKSFRKSIFKKLVVT